MIKVKFRVYVEKMCRKCNTIHQLPTHRDIFYMCEGTEDEAIQKGHAHVVSLLNGEGKNLRPLFQYTFEVL